MTAGATLPVKVVAAQELPVAVVTAQELAEPAVEAATIWSKLRVWNVSSLCGWRSSAPQMPA